MKNVFAAARQSPENVPRSLEEVERASGSVQTGSGGSDKSFNEGLLAVVDRAIALVAKRGLAKQTLL